MLVGDCGENDLNREWTRIDANESQNDRRFFMRTWYRRRRYAHPRDSAAIRVNPRPFAVSKPVLYTRWSATVGEMI